MRDNALPEHNELTSRQQNTMPSTLYKRLPDQHTIRLLRVDPAQSQSQAGRVEGSLKVVSLNKAPSYQALSYTWGNGVLCEKIYIDGQTVHITRNLYAGLLRIRHPNEQIYTWVDALSIRQDDAEEKTQQVSIIGRMFATASLVIVWLGEHADGSEHLFQSPAISTNHACYRFLKRGYWRRTWVVQEIAAAQSLLIQCGHDCSSWAALEKLLDPKKKNQPLLPRDYRERFQQVAALFENTTRPDWMTSDLVYEPHINMQELFECVWKFRNTECQDPRDKVFALLSLLGPNTSIEPDYTSTPAELFVRVCVGGLVDYQMVLLAEILDLKEPASCQAILEYVLDEDLLAPSEARDYSPRLVYIVDRLLSMWISARDWQSSPSDEQRPMTSMLASDTARTMRKLDLHSGYEDHSVFVQSRQNPELTQLVEAIPSAHPSAERPILDARQSARELLQLIDAEMAGMKDLPVSDSVAATSFECWPVEVHENHHQALGSTRPFENLRHIRKGFPTVAITEAHQFTPSPMVHTATRGSSAALRAITEAAHFKASSVGPVVTQASNAAAISRSITRPRRRKQPGVFGRMNMPTTSTVQQESTDS